MADIVSADDPRLGPVILDAPTIAARVAELGAEIAAAYPGEAPLFVGVLKGAFVFMGDLARATPATVECDFMAVSSYGSSTKTSGVVRIVKDLDLDLQDRHVVLVEDIVDSGLTLNYLVKNLRSRRPASLEVCTLLLKDGGAARVDPELRWIGFTIPDEFVVGYGLDVAERFRNLPDLRLWRGEK